MNTPSAKKEKKVLKKKETVPLSIENSAEVAYYYGFTHIHDLKIEKEDTEMTKSALEMVLERKNEHPLFIYPEEKVALLRDYIEENPHGQIQPSMLYHEHVAGSRRRGSSEEKRFHLDIIGTTKSIAEAVLIKTAMEVLKEEGFENLLVEINSIGDKESVGRFLRDLGNYFKKNPGVVSAHCKQIIKSDPYDALLCENEKCQAMKENAPHPISSLSESSRKHFSEILEYLEVLKIPYKINTGLLHCKKLCLGTIFEIRDLDSNSPLARGVRYNSLSKKLGYKKELGAVGLSSCFKKTKTPHPLKSTKGLKVPKIYFIQLGFNAKLKSLEIIEILRKEKIPLAQGLVKDKLAPQLQIAENSKIPYTIIMGQKEAMENSIIVRSMATRSQETIPISQLAEYLKKIK